MMKARTSLWASLAIAASIGLAGCGGSNDNNDGSTAEELAAAQKAAEDAQAAEAAAKAAQAAAEAKANEAEQATARVDARRFIETADYSVQAIDSKDTLTKAFVSGSATTTIRLGGGQVSLQDIPALKQDEADENMYSGTSDDRTWTARVYTTIEDDKNKSFVDNLPGDALTTPAPGRTTKGFYLGGTFTFDDDSSATSTTADSASVGDSGIKADDFPTSAGVKTYKVNE